MTQEDLEALCAEWQGRLRLQDWNITPLLVRRYQMDDYENWGELSYNLPHKAATIKITDPQDAEPNRGYDPEATLVHELLHVHVATFCPSLEHGSIPHTLMEQAVNRIEECIMTIWRGMAVAFEPAGAGTADEEAADDA